ncbi:DEAD/DEAH box helicase [Trichococcus shcherbakoviae]|uniref:DEAD/DEAH box helicase n=1 Tax=Trichococcus shcherbakoviae TaxID=2094020 RepID=UPI002AA66DE9|nr:DEAD/DEAH box helicase [Trichococcus shcherbakoviae]
MTTATNGIVIQDGTLSVHFGNFSIAEYDMFLKVKALPEYQVTFNEADESYTITAPSRFAPLLGVQIPNIRPNRLPFPSFMFDDQVAILKMALEAKRFACWSDCGLGKTLIQLEFARQVIHTTGGKALIFTLNEIVQQTIDECQRWYGDSLPIVRLKTREEMRQWCKSPGPGLAITNYEKMNHKGDADQVVNELRHLAAVILDESDRLKGGGGKQKWALIKSCRGIEHKLSCTATPAPNDTIEFASQASFLEKMRSDNDIIWTFFARDTKTKEWTVKSHARKAFFQFMSAWSIYVRDPKKYGWRIGQPEVPKPIVKVVDIDPTPEQIKAMQRLCPDASGQMNLIESGSVNAIQRNKLSQIAKGFRYIKGESHGKYRLIPSRKPDYVADLIARELRLGLQVLVWTTFDAESDLIAQRLRERGIPFDLLVGKVKDADRIPILERFRHGISRLLISRASMVGYGQNFQQCGSMIFSGWNDSYVAYYQAIRRSYRYGQTRRLRVWLPVIRTLEGDMLDNIFHKQDKHEAAIAEMEQNYIKAVKQLKGVA